ncbi:MAG: type II toxin-antitoxin system mRNA interferase toxin, RelE/StbE family [Candidatus Magasanikbacteria bacterium]|nr:type II toxin-antitoxin system mRNA interferase toxin, RelE/StbE family [Candidatus Magasanikbacteria bacterium]
MFDIFYSPKFIKEYRRLPVQIQEMAEQKEKLFRFNPFDPRLKTHKLSGKLRGCWAFSINHNYRIIFTFESEKEIRFHTIGTHSIYTGHTKLT